MKTHYELLDVSREAPADEIKKAFRREIARYHPDKVQHLGPEFQDIAAVRAAELTEAYRVLMDASLRAQYDERLRSGAPVPPPHAPSSARPPSPISKPPQTAAADPPPSSSTASQAKTEHATTSDFVRKAGSSRLRDAVAAVSGSAAILSVAGFDAAYDIKGKGGMFRKGEPSVRLLAKFVPQVDAAAVTSSWPDALRAGKGHDQLCVLLFGAAGVAPTKELAAAIAEQRRKTRGVVPIVVPVDVRDWDALFPPETPPSVRAVMQWLRQGTV